MGRPGSPAGPESPTTPLDFGTGLIAAVQRASQAAVSSSVDWLSKVAEDAKPDDDVDPNELSLTFNSKSLLQH